MNAPLRWFFLLPTMITLDDGLQQSNLMLFCPPFLQTWEAGETMRLTTPAVIRWTTISNIIQIQLYWVISSKGRGERCVLVAGSPLTMGKSGGWLTTAVTRDATLACLARNSAVSARNKASDFHSNFLYYRGSKKPRYFNMKRLTRPPPKLKAVAFNS